MLMGMGKGCKLFSLAPLFFDQYNPVLPAQQTGLILHNFQPRPAVRDLAQPAVGVGAEEAENLA